MNRGSISGNYGAKKHTKRSGSLGGTIERMLTQCVRNSRCDVKIWLYIVLDCLISLRVQWRQQYIWTAGHYGNYHNGIRHAGSTKLQLTTLSGFTNESQPISLPFSYLLTLSVKLLSHYIIEYQKSRDLDPQHAYRLAYVSEKNHPQTFVYVNWYRQSEYSYFGNPFGSNG